jgi:hypothetical protein
MVGAKYVGALRYAGRSVLAESAVRFEIPIEADRFQRPPGSKRACEAKVGPYRTPKVTNIFLRAATPLRLCRRRQDAVPLGGPSRPAEI